MKVENGPQKKKWFSDHTRGDMTSCPHTYTDIYMTVIILFKVMIMFWEDT